MLHPNAPSGLYVIAPNSGYPSKIGISANPSVRLSEIQTGCWEELKMHSFVFAMPKGEQTASEAAQKLEASTHRSLRKHGLGLVGEWFDLEASEAASAIKKVARDRKIRLVKPDLFIDRDPNKTRVDIEIPEYLGFYTVAHVASRLISESNAT